MTKHLTLLLFIGLAWGQTTIAVFDFENNGLGKSEARQLSTRLESELVKVGKYNVVERGKIDEILKEQKLQISGCVEECLIDVGKLLGAKQIILGSVGKLGSIYTISVKLVDANSGELLKTSDFDTERGLGALLTVGMKKVALEIANQESKVSPNELKDRAIPMLGKSLNPKDTHSDLKGSSSWFRSDSIEKSLEIGTYPISYDTAPVALTPIKPDYPIEAELIGLTGVVILQVFIDKKGDVLAMEVLKGHHELLNESAMVAVRETKFKPAIHKGISIGVWVSIPINFRL